jgi:hypothetical protein
MDKAMVFQAVMKLPFIIKSLLRSLCSLANTMDLRIGFLKNVVA